MLSAQRNIFFLRSVISPAGNTADFRMKVKFAGSKLCWVFYGLNGLSTDRLARREA